MSVEPALADLTPEQRERVHDMVGWDHRKELTDIFQEAGGRFGSDSIAALDSATYHGLLAVAQWAAARAILDSDAAD